MYAFRDLLFNTDFFSPSHHFLGEGSVQRCVVRFTILVEIGYSKRNCVVTLNCYVTEIFQDTRWKVQVYIG